MKMLYKIHLIAATRPNFMKVAPLYHALKRQTWAKPQIIHTGQHYDVDMSNNFFSDLRLPLPKVNLGIGSGSHAQQTAGVMLAYEKFCLKDRPDLVVVVGDVNSTLACALAMVKTGFKVAHLEAGLRSFDRSMPEEINRLLTDAISDILWTPSYDADENLMREGIPKEKIQRVGNIMIDSLEMLRPIIIQERTLQNFNLKKKGYGVITLHRPSNVDVLENLRFLCRVIKRITRITPLVFPVHPRTENNLKQYDLFKSLKKIPNLKLTQPLSYCKFMNLLFNARFVLTDSGGIQEESTYLGIPCLTLRKNTERPITITEGTNKLTGFNKVFDDVQFILKYGIRKRSIPKLWDGRTALRVVASIRSIFKIV